MKIGIISDTHSNISATKRAADVFAAQNTAAVFHCGDIGSFEVLTELAVTGIPVHAVLGNVDSYSSDFKFYPTDIGVQLYGRFAEIEVGEFQIALLHGDDRRRYFNTVNGGTYDLVFSGHSHAVHDYQKDGTRCLNPGTAGRENPGTCGVLDLETGEYKIFKI